MFTGLVEACVPLRALERRGSGARLRGARPELPPGAAAWEPRPGESISISGVCLTVVETAADGSTSFDLSAETLGRSWLATASPGRPVNLERALRLADRLGGHLVAGHVDGLGRIVAVEDRGDGGRWMELEAPEGFERWLVEKGSVAVDGVSLTVVEPRGRRFAAALIPETLERTSLGRARPDDPVHLEGDLLAKWVAQLLGPYHHPRTS